MTTVQISVPAGTVPITLQRQGQGRPVLLLHGGPGPGSMLPLVSALDGFEAVLTTHPGFDGTPRPAWLSSIAGLAGAYIALLDALSLDGVVVVGNSAGGWLAAEMAARRPKSLAGIVLLNAVGLEPTAATGPIANPAALAPQELARLAFADPAKARLLASPDATARMQANQQTLMAYAGQPFMHDPTLAVRLADIGVPSLVLWGARDGIVTPDYGREFAGKIRGARFEQVEAAAHFPQIEATVQVAEAIRAFSDAWPAAAGFR